MADLIELADALDDMIPCECAVCGPDDRVATLRSAAATLRVLDEVLRAARDADEDSCGCRDCRECRALAPLRSALARVGGER